MLQKQGTCDNLTYFVFDTREEMGKKAAADIAARIRALLREKETINMIFAAAPSQNEVLAALIAEKDLPWQRVNAFHMDEYIGLSPDAPQRFGTFLKNAVFSRVPFKSVHYIDGSGDPAAECARYGALLEQYPTDIVVLGIGENGHIAFNDPPVADFADPKLVKPVALDQVCRQQQVNDGCFPALNAVPETALTLTVPALFRGKHLFCVVPGSTKRAAVTAALTGPIGQQCPASVLREHPSAALYCDKKSGANL